MPKTLWEIYKKGEMVEAWFTLVDKRELKCYIPLEGDEKVTENQDNVDIAIEHLSWCRYEVSEGTLEPNTKYGLVGTTKVVSKGTAINTYTSSYRLEEIDNLREYILKQGKKEILIKSNSTEEWLGVSFIKDVLVGTAKSGESEPKIKME